MKQFTLNLRIKILSGFLILSLMLLIAGAWSIREFTHIGTSVQQLLDNNYRSINAAKMMLEALERQDRAVLLILAGNRDEGRGMIMAGDNLFQRGFKIAGSNITEPGEQNQVAEIERSYRVYKNQWQMPMAATHEEDVNRYFGDIHRTFLEAKLAVERLYEMNVQAMYKTASSLKARAHRATMPGIVAIVSAFLFALMFSYLINYYVVNPITMITRNIDEFLRSGQKKHLKIEGADELIGLAASIDNLTARVKN